MGKGELQIDQLSIKSPYGERSTYRRYDRGIPMFEGEDGRRPGGYVVATPGRHAG